MSNRHQIMVVDDDKISRKALNSLLKNRYDTVCAQSGEECLELLKDHRPDILLLDVVMPEMDGYELCQHIKNRGGSHDMITIFISGNINSDSIIEGYESGGHDYITKPVDKVVLLQKIELNLKALEKQRLLEENLKMSTNTAFAAMRESSDYGQLLNFMRDSLECGSYEELASNIFRVTNDIGVNCSLKIRSASGDIDLTSHGATKPLEAALLTELEGQGRFFDFKDRTIVNFDQISMLVKNMPVDDKERYGRIRDSICTLLTAANARISTLDKLKNVEIKRNVVVDQAIENVHKAIINIESSVKRQERASLKIIDDLTLDMERTVMALGLAEGEEVNLLKILSKSTAGLSSIHKESIDLDRLFESTLGTLSELVKSNE